MKKYSFVDQILPIQPYFARYFKGSEADFYQSLFDLILKTSRTTEDSRTFSVVGPEDFPWDEMSTPPVQVEFIKFLVHLGGFRRILEVGTFVGFTTMHLASILPEDGRIVTVEKFDRFARFALENFKRNNLDQKISLINADGLDAAAQMEPGSFDFIYYDGNKERYADLFTSLDKLLTPGGLMITDDVFFCGDVLNKSPETEKGQGVRDLYDRVAADNRYYVYLLPICDGMLLMKKK